MIKLDKITEIEIQDGWLIINQFDNQEILLSPENVIKLKEYLKL